jgi:tetratricopeptide (TPR) repeat protein
LCACLPLALAVAAARAVARPTFPLAALANELADSAARLDALDAGDPAASVRTVFSWSTRQLTREAARMFRLAGLHPGPDISIPAAACLTGCGQPQARRLLRELARAHLIGEHIPGRYAFHDLLHTYAAEQAHHTDSQAERDSAIGRLLDYYLHSAHAASLQYPSHDSNTLAPPRAGVVPEKLASSAEAMTWFEAERQVLLAATTLATQNGYDAHAWQIPWTMTDYLNRRGYWQQNAASQRTAVAAATRLGDTVGQAFSHRGLANACIMLGDYSQARASLMDCLQLYRQLRDRTGEAKVHQALGRIAVLQSHYADALGHAQQSLRLYQAADHPMGQAESLNNVGWSHALLGDYQQASAFCKRALALSFDIGDRRNEAHSWDSLGYAEHHLGRHAEAAACYQRALSGFRELGDRFNEADALTHLGDTCLAADELWRARNAWQQALELLDDLHHPDADKVRAKLADTNDHAARNPGPPRGSGVSL